MKKFTEEEVQEKRTKVEKTQEKPAEKTKKQGPGGGTDAEYGYVQADIPKEKGLRAWLSRNAVAFCTLFIGFFSVMLLAALEELNVYENAMVLFSLASVLFSIPLLLIKTDHWIMRLAGWFGALSGSFIFLLLLVGISPDRLTGGSFFWHLVLVYFLDTVILGVMARKGAFRNRLVVPQWEQKIRAWASRNVVTFCNVFIASFLSLFCSWFFVGADQQLYRIAGVVVVVGSFVLLFLSSISLVLSTKGGAMVSNAGWLGVFCIPYIFLVDAVVDISSDEFFLGWLGLLFYLSLYTLVAILLAFFGRVFNKVCLPQKTDITLWQTRKSLPRTRSLLTLNPTSSLVSWRASRLVGLVEF